MSELIASQGRDDDCPDPAEVALGTLTATAPTPEPKPPIDVGRAARQGGVWAVLSHGLTKASGFASSIVLARILLPQDFGLAGMVNTVLGVAQVVGNCGIGAALIHQREEVEDYANITWWLDMFFGVGLFVLANLVGPLAAAHYHEPRVRLLVLVASTNFLINPIGGAMDFLLQRDLRFKDTMRINLIQGVMVSAFSILLVVLGAGVWSFIYPHVIANVAAVVIRWRLCSFRPSRRIEWRRARKLVGFGKNVMGANIFRYINENVDYILVGALMGGTQLGLYVFAYNLGVWIVQNITMTVTSVVFPTFSSVQNDPDRARALFLKLIGLIALIGLPIVCIQWAIAPLYVGSIYDPKWLGSVTAFRFIALYGMGRAICSPALSLIAAMGRPDVSLKVNAAMCPVLVAAIIIGSRHGINGVAAATAMAHGVFVWFYLLIPFRILKWKLSDVAVALAPAVVCSVGTGLIVGLVYRLAGGGVKSLALLAELLALGIACYALLNAILFRKASSDLIALVKTTVREARAYHRES